MPFIVKLSREIPMQWFDVTLPNGDSEEMEAEELREWFRLRGADELVVEKAMDYVWNMGRYKPVYVEIANFKDPLVKLEDSATPNLQGD